MKVRLCCLITLSNDVRQGKNGIWTMWFSHEWSKKIGWWGMCFTWTRHEISWCVCTFVKGITQCDFSLYVYIKQ